MATPDPKKGDIVSFQLVINGVNGDERVDVKVDGLINYQVARMIDPQLAVKHAALYPYFSTKVGNVDDPSKYDYMVVQGRNGQVEVIGIPWIQDATFRIIDGRTATVLIDNWREDFRAPLKTFMANLGANMILHIQEK